MTEPLSTTISSVTAAGVGITAAANTTIATTTATAIGILSLLPGIDTSLVLGAFAGAAVFVMSASDLAPLKKIGFFLVSFLAGYVAAGFVAEIIAVPLFNRIQVPTGVGALIASAVAVKALLWLIGKTNDIDGLLKLIKEKK